MKGNIPRPEYPRPDFQRKQWLNLNGEWYFEFDDYNIGESEKWYLREKFSQKIIVPFCYQSKASGIGSQEMHEYLWYKREFELGENFKRKRILLNFGAVDYSAKVWINGSYAGGHKGGYTPYKIDITRLISCGKNTITVKAEDKYECVQPTGKQYWKEKPDRCWYTGTSGIWQTVWLEVIGDIAVDRLRLSPDIDERNVLAEIYLDGFEADLEALVEVSYNNTKVVEIKTKLKDRIAKLTLDIKEADYVDEVHYWSPESPNLYDVKLTILKGNFVLDEVKSYFGMRKISVKGDLILLNNRPYYQKLILDQGYWTDSLLTPPSDDAIIYDIKMTKEFGFNGARKHQKVEDPRYYYWADKLGLIVWGEMPSGYQFNIEEIENITGEWVDFINRDYNHPCIAVWVPLNESWGVRNIIKDKQQQNFARGLYYTTKALDATRLISTNDGWELIQDTDICGIHDYAPSKESFAARYFDKEDLLNTHAQGRMLFADGHKYTGQPIMITEYGGIAFASENKDNWGYFGTVSSEEEFLKRYEGVTSAIKDTSYVRGYCYTQLTDVMQEINGLMTMDRKPKMPPEKIRDVN